MGEHVEINGHRTWLHRSGAGERTVLLLHGGMSCSEDMLGPFEEPLGASYRVAAFDRIGHGYTGDTDGPFHYESMADEVIGVIEHLGAPVHLVGWSDGGIAALLASRKRPDLVDRQVLIGANFHNDGVILDGLDGLDGLDEGDDAMRLMGAGYAQRSPDGPEHFPVVYEKFMRLARTEPTLTTSDLATIRTPTLVLAGDDDMITLDHTLALYDALPESQLAIVPGSSHAVPLERPALVASLILDFLAGPVPPRTFLPVRRAVGGGR